MTTVTVNNREWDRDAVVHRMDDELRDYIHNEIDFGETEQDFVDMYCKMHAVKFGEDFVIN